MCAKGTSADNEISGQVLESGGTALIGATLVRALVLSAAFAGFLTPAHGDQMTAKAIQEPSLELLSLLQQKRISKHSPILLRVFKEESELEVWKQDNSGHFQVLKVYPICRWSGDIGPKLHEGDRQAPEGFYTITPELMNPNSNFYLAIIPASPTPSTRQTTATAPFS